ncbi:Phosphatidylglycerol/phosphatidylinositol transfer protein [Teratosphaeriaceae sp. CCFEE 6253]|nr:Phosphatidylglycerol/phosphatidylinositol transfer protein [Teratosphaeriaceae sp. CCFEE 6253]
MQTAQIISLAFTLAGAMAAPRATTLATSASAAPAAYSSDAAAAPESTGFAQLNGLKVPGSNTLMYCSDPSKYLMIFDDITVNPLPPVPGQNVTVHLSGALAQPITAGAAHKVQFGKISADDGEEHVLFSSTSNLCAGIDRVPDAVLKQFSGQKCPIPAGPFNITNTIPIPEPPAGKGPPPMPKGEFFVRGTTTLASGEEVSCFMADLKAEGQLATA